MIFFSNLLGVLDTNISLTSEQIDKFMPHDVVILLESCFDYVSNSSSYKLLWFSLAFSIWFPMRTAKGIMDTVRVAYHLEKPENSVRYMIKQLLYTVVFLFVIVACLILTIIGKNFMLFSWSITSDESIWLAEIFAGMIVVYALSPIDLVPDVVPVFGYLDDVIILPALIALTIKYIPKDVLERCRIQSEGMWQDGKPKEWYYAIPIIAIWLIVFLLILYCEIKKIDLFIIILFGINGKENKIGKSRSK